MPKILTSIVLLVGLLLAGMGSGHAQATRTWVSGVGDDANPCSRTAPCKTFQGAINKTAGGGQISVLDPGGFGSVTITKSISIVAEGDLGSILVSSGSGITVNAGATGVVYLRNLDIAGIGASQSGINIVRAAAVHVSNTSIHGFNSAGTGISVVPSLSPVDVVVSDSRITDNVNGIRVRPTGGQRVNVMLDNVTIANHSGNAIETFTPRTAVSLNNCVISGNKRAVAKRSNSVVNTYGNNVFQNNELNGPAPSPVALK
jgi:hypothetical protein